MADAPKVVNLKGEAVEPHGDTPAEAIELLRKVNAQVNAQGAFDENLFERFAAVGAYFGRK